MVIWYQISMNNQYTIKLKKKNYFFTVLTLRFFVLISFSFRISLTKFETKENHILLRIYRFWLSCTFFFIIWHPKISNENSRKSAKFFNCGFSKDSGRSRLQINELSARENKCLHCGVFKKRTQNKPSQNLSCFFRKNP